MRSFYARAGVRVPMTALVLFPSLLLTDTHVRLRMYRISHGGGRGA